MRKTQSLSWRLSWQVGVAQVLAFVLLGAVMCIAFLDRSIGQLPHGTAIDVAEALGYEHGRLRFDPALLPQEFTTQAPHAWALAKDDLGNIAAWGKAPKAFEAWVPIMGELEPTDIKSNVPPFRSATKLIVHHQGGRTLRVLVGGYGGYDLAGAIAFIAIYLAPWVGLPLMVTSVVVIPLVVHRRLKGMNEVARLAAQTDLSRRTKPLEAADVPVEIRPLIDGFNQALQRIWDVSEARDRFLADAAHELRMPIAILTTRVSGLEAGAAKDELMLDVARLQNITEQLLDIQRVDRRIGVFERFDLVAIAQDVAEVTAPLIVANGYEFSWEPPDRAQWVEGDAGAIQRVITCLVQNAIDHGSKQGEIRIVVGPDCSVSVFDQGEGVPSEASSRIFEPFFRLRPSGAGSGLGLYLAAEIVKKHRGVLTVSQPVQGGCCFTMRLPSAGSPISGER